jgi:DGQHR domain-containing protein
MSDLGAVNLDHTRPELKTQSFSAIRVMQKDYVFYLSVLPVSTLVHLGAGLKASGLAGAQGELSRQDQQALVDSLITSEFAKEVEQLQAQTYDESDPFQRVIDETRIRAISAYLQEENALMANPIILASRDSTEVEIAPVDNSSFVSLSLTWTENVPTNIIDGQHRLEALRRLVATGHATFNDFEVPFTILFDVPFYLQAELFSVINGRQKPVNRSRIYDLLGYRAISDPKLRDKAYRGEMAVHRFCHHIVRTLNESRRSPWNSLIKMRGAGAGVVTQAAFVDHLTQFVVPRKDSNRLVFLPVFYPYFKNNDLVGLAKVLVLYFLGIRRAWPTYWESAESLRASFFGKTNGVAVMFRLLHDMIIMEGDAEQLSVEIVAEYWRRAPAERIESPPAGGGRGYQNEWYAAIRAVMFQDGNEFESKKKEMRKKLKAWSALYV